jgi:hypothetical protein
MSNKTLSILSYVTIIGWLISFFQYRKTALKSDQVQYHLKQGLGVFIVSLIFMVGLTIIAAVIPALSFLRFAGCVFLIFMNFGIMNADDEQKKPIPLIGRMFENQFGFIN